MTKIVRRNIPDGSITTGIFSKIVVVLTLLVMLWGMGPNYSEQQVHSFSVYAHRFFGMILGFFALSLTISLKKRGSPFFKDSLFVSLYLLIQGTIGASSALKEMPTIIGVAHFLFSLWTLGAVIGLDHLIGEEGEKREGWPFPPWIKDVASLALGLIGVQMILGVLVKQTGASGVCATGSHVLLNCLETATGIQSWWPSTSPAQLHMLHRFGAVVTGLSNLSLSVLGMAVVGYRPGLSWERRHLFYSCLLLILLTFLQFYSGAFALYKNFPTLVSLSHGAFSIFMFALVFKLILSLRTMEYQTHGGVRHTFVSNMVELAKPRLAALVMLTVVVGFLCSPGKADYVSVFTALILIFFSVASGSILNCYMERHIDKLMERTKERPLPSGRMKASTALVAGLFTALFSLVGLYTLVNALTAYLAVVGLFFYLFLYTPLKRKSPFALWPGAVSGAIAPLMGLSMTTESLEPMAYCLFIILFFWQIPHFLAISIYRAREYHNAGLIVYSNTMGIRAIRLFVLGATLTLTGVSFLPFLWAKSSLDSLLASTVINVLFLIVAASGLWIKEIMDDQRRWGRILFYASLIHWPLLLGSIVFF